MRSTSEPKAVCPPDVSVFKVTPGAKLEWFCDIRVIMGRIIHSWLLRLAEATERVVEVWRCVWDHGRCRSPHWDWDSGTHARQTHVPLHHELCGACDATTTRRPSACVRPVTAASGQRTSGAAWAGSIGRRTDLLFQRQAGMASLLKCLH